MLAKLPDPNPVFKAANLSPNPKAPKLPLPTTLPPTVPKLPIPPMSLPAPNPDKPPISAPLRPLPAAKLVPAPITPASIGPTPGIKLANGPITGATFLITFLMPLASFLKKPCCSIPVNVFKDAKPVPKTISSGSRPISIAVFSTSFSMLGFLSIISLDTFRSPDLTCAIMSSSPAVPEISCIKSVYGALADIEIFSIIFSISFISLGSLVCDFCICKPSMAIINS